MSIQENSSPPAFLPARALYVHVPFCMSKCRYCDFYSLPQALPSAAAYIAACRSELEMAMASSQIRGPLRSVFVGGGTPTHLPPRLLEPLLTSIGPLVDSSTEFSIEANLGTLSLEVAQSLIHGGINRVSVGIQSLVESELKILGRSHSPATAKEALATLKACGINNLGADLIYGIPGQTAQSWRQTLTEALELGIDHLSCYALSFENGTPLGDDLAHGRLHEMDEFIQKDLYYLAIDLAGNAGLEHYEISNFARPGKRCRHNLTYWRNDSYLGIGPAAASYVGGIRRTNRPDLAGYLSAIQAGQLPPADSECVPPAITMGESMMLGLRLIEGVDRAGFFDRFGKDLLQAFPQTLTRYLPLGALVLTPSHLRLDQKALFAADAILADFIAEARRSDVC